MKWHWRFIQEDADLWKEVLVAKHGTKSQWSTKQSTLPYGTRLWKTINTLWDDVFKQTHFEGELVKVFANEHRKITCDPVMHNCIEKTLYSGHATYKVSLSTRYLDIWEPATLAIKRDGYSIKANGLGGVPVSEKFSQSTIMSGNGPRLHGKKHLRERCQDIGLIYTWKEAFGANEKYTSSIWPWEDSQRCTKPSGNLELYVHIPVENLRRTRHGSRQGRGMEPGMDIKKTKFKGTQELKNLVTFDVKFKNSGSRAKGKGKLSNEVQPSFMECQVSNVIWEKKNSQNQVLDWKANVVRLQETKLGLICCT
ncbi:putative ethylene-responsive transcription factor-like [Capsicum annuum]|nr:putative ethylene-responsive transcription factor-like [Capsicum annuum]